MKKIERSYFDDKTSQQMAKLLLGKFIVKITGNGVIVAKILETEAYFGTIDKASTAYGGTRLTENNVLYGEPGHLYVCNRDNLYNAFAIVTSDKGNPSYVIIRRVEILEGFDAASINRFNRKYDQLTETEKAELGSSSSKVAGMFSITSVDNGMDLCSAKSLIYISDDDTITKMFGIIQEKRLGIDYAEEYRDMPWRYIYDGEIKK